MALRISQIQCAASEQGLLWNYLGRRWPFFPEQNIKWNSISTSPKQKKEWKLQSNSIQEYSEMENSPLISRTPPPPIIRFQDTPTRIHPFPTRLPLYSEQVENGS
ncbi:hypothetical protein CDAR_281511 [Caerostris darwini]|uniref:Uncharacterized protein n=1 Tax=Caerostris darwini TaxID=1538125 RepID=A0AAV4QXI7_9ARAC|nr:hypothetical protein CDAR_281511 [Caerostris darwini]